MNEWRRETRRKASRRSTQRAFFYSLMEKQNNFITRELLIIATWSIEQKLIIFQCRTDVRDEHGRREPVRPGRIDVRSEPNF